MDITVLTVDVNAIEQGRWIDKTDVPELEDTRINTRGINNSAWRAAFAKKVAAIPRAERRSGLTPDAIERITGECLIETGIIAWEGLTENGQPIEIDRVKQMLADPRYAPMRDLALVASRLVGETAAEDVNDAGKN